MQCGVSKTNAYTFTTQSSVVISVTSAEPNLDCILVDETASNHPNAPDGIKTGTYWTIRALQSDRTSDASVYALTHTTAS